MEGKRDEVIRKGPWKAEEDEVLINHVNKYGPRDWSSIRSKGLLQRTGKSCRLRWVNKLRPNLKNGCKFSAEEERIVIELQAQFGNKWARIAKYLQGRTDNDVKNFWSSRQKRLARLLQNSTAIPKSQRNKKEIAPVNQNASTLEPSSLITSMDEESSSRAHFCSLPYLDEESSSKAQFCSLPYIDNPEPTKMVPVSDLINPKLQDTETNHVQIDCPLEENLPCYASHLPGPMSHMPLPEDDLIFSSEGEGQEIFPPINDPDLYNFFGAEDVVKFENGAPFPVGPSYIEPSGTQSNFPNDANVDPVTPDNFLDDFPSDFPTDMFDNIELPPSSAKW